MTTLSNQSHPHQLFFQTLLSYQFCPLDRGTTNNKVLNWTIFCYLKMKRFDQYWLHPSVNIKKKREREKEKAKHAFEWIISSSSSVCRRQPSRYGNQSIGWISSESAGHRNGQLTGSRQWAQWAQCCSRRLSVFSLCLKSSSSRRQQTAADTTDHDSPILIWAQGAHQQMFREERERERASLISTLTLRQSVNFCKVTAKITFKLW